MEEICEETSTGANINVRVPMYDSSQQKDEVYDHVEDITEIGNNYEQIVSALGGMT